MLTHVRGLMMKLVTLIWKLEKLEINLLCPRLHPHHFSRACSNYLVAPLAGVTSYRRGGSKPCDSVTVCTLSRAGHPPIAAAQHFHVIFPGGD